MEGKEKKLNLSYHRNEIKSTNLAPNSSKSWAVPVPVSQVSPQQLKLSSHPLLITLL